MNTECNRTSITIKLNDPVFSDLPRPKNKSEGVIKGWYVTNDNRVVIAYLTFDGLFKSTADSMGERIHVTTLPDGLFSSEKTAYQWLRNRIIDEYTDILRMVDNRIAEAD